MPEQRTSRPDQRLADNEGPARTDLTTTPPAAAQGLPAGERNPVPRMFERSPVVRSTHDLGLAVWFGGSLASAVAFNGGRAPSSAGPVANVQRQFKVCHWLVPGLTAALHVLNAVHGEQQRPQQQLPGILAKPAQLLGVAA